MPAFEEVPEELRYLLPPGVADIGGKAAFTIDHQMIEEFKEGREFFGEVAKASLALAKNLKLNGSNFEETWAGLLVLGHDLEAFGDSAPVMLAYLLTTMAFPDQSEA